MDFKHTMWVEGEGIETIKMGGGRTEMEFEYELMITLFLHKIQLIIPTQTDVCNNKWFCLFCFIYNTK